MANFIGQGNYTSKLNQILIISAPPEGIAEFFSALNIFLSITAAVSNALILTALKNVSSIHPPTKLFYRCLAVTDLFVGLIVQPLYAAYIILSTIKMTMNVLYHVSISLGALGMTLCGVSVASVGAILCVVTSIFCYSRIHLKLRHQQAQVQSNVPHGQQNAEGIPLNIAGYKKSVSSIMWVQLALVACYLPAVISVVVDANGIQHDVAWFAALTLVYLNSFLNPILCCWKVREVKQAV